MVMSLIGHKLVRHMGAQDVKQQLGLLPQPHVPCDSPNNPPPPDWTRVRVRVRVCVRVRVRVRVCARVRVCVRVRFTLRLFFFFIFMEILFFIRLLLIIYKFFTNLERKNCFFFNLTQHIKKKIIYLIDYKTK
jgi:hypothetical protein